MLDGDNRSHALAGVVAGKVGVGVLQQAGLAGIIVDHAGQRHAQTGHVGAAIHRVDGVGERIDGFIVGIGELDCHFNANIVHFLFGIKNRVQGNAVAVEVADEGSNAAFKEERHLLVAAFIHQPDFHLPGDKRHLAETLGECFKLEIDIVLEDLGIKPEGCAGAGLAGVAFANRLDRLLGDAALVTLEIYLALAAHFHLAPFGEGIDR